MEYSEVLKIIKEKGVTSALAKQIAGDPDLYKKLANTANYRIRKLRENDMRDASYAYKMLVQDLGRKTVPNERSGRADRYRDIIDIAAFLAADTSTIEGIHKVRENKRNALRENILKTVTFESEKAKKQFLFFFDSLNEEQMDKLTKAYDQMLSADFDSGQKFQVFTADILNKFDRRKRINVQQLFESILNSSPNTRIRDWQMEGGNLRDATTKEIMRGIR